MSLLYPPNPWCEWCNVWRLKVESPLLFLNNGVGSFTSHKNQISVSAVRRDLTVFRPYPRRLESLTVCRCHYEGSTFFSVISKILSVGPAGVRTRDLPLSRRALSQLSQPGGGLLVVHRYPSQKSIKKWVLRSPMNEENRYNTIQSLVYHFVMCSVNWVSSVLIILSIRRVPLKSIFQVKWTPWYYYYHYYYYYYYYYYYLHYYYHHHYYIIINWKRS